VLGTPLVAALAAATLGAGAFAALHGGSAPAPTEVTDAAVVQRTAAPAPARPSSRPARPAPTRPRAPQPVVPTFGGDISWPNCPLGTPGHLPKRPAKGLPMPGPDAQFVVIGLTNGPGFHPNPCLAWQVAHAKGRQLLTAAYAFTTLPNAAQTSRYGGKGPWPPTSRLGRYRNAAFAEAQVNVDSIRRTGLRTPIVWMDIEPQDYLSPWGTDVTVNRAVIRAAQEAYHRAGFRTGFYSAPYAWESITAGMRDSSPTWVTSGPRSRATAAAKCAGPSFSGGPVALSQFWVEDVADYDLTCPLVREDVGRFFATNEAHAPTGGRGAPG
jgi:hypothetical protein